MAKNILEEIIEDSSEIEELFSRFFGFLRSSGEVKVERIHDRVKGYGFELKEGGSYGTGYTVSIDGEMVGWLEVYNCEENQEKKSLRYNGFVPGATRPRKYGPQTPLNPSEDPIRMSYDQISETRGDGWKDIPFP